MIFFIETDSQLEIRDLKTLTLEKINVDIYIYGLYFWFIILVYNFENNFYKGEIKCVEVS